jgi:ribosome maturation factor RimP
MTECREVGLARFFLALKLPIGMNRRIKDQQAVAIEQRIGEVEPEAELLAVEPAGKGSLRIYIDHPDGVTLELCEKITAGLTELREDYSVEVSSPGPSRPLVRPEHFSRFEGRHARIRTSESIEGQRKFTGTILGATDSGMTLGLDDRVHEFSYDQIERANLVPHRKEGASE